MTGKDMTTCWICHEEKTVEDQGEHKWVKHCKCSLECHEECLLTWIESQEATGGRGQKFKCPQCLKEYHIVEAKSYLYQFMTFMEAVIDSLSKGSIAAGAVTTLLLIPTAYSAYAIYSICDGGDINEILKYLQRTRPISWIATPIISLGVLGTTFGVLPPFSLAVPLVIFRSRAISLEWPPDKLFVAAALPLIKSVYRYVWSRTIGRLQRTWTNGFLRGQPQEAGMDAAQVDNIDDQGGAEGLQILIDFHREDRNNGEGNAPHDQEGQLQEQRPLGGMWRRRLMPRKLSFKYFALALYSPTIAMACGSLLARIPLVRALFPQKFYQTVLGGLTFAVTRDFLRVLYSYLSYRIRNSRRIV